MKYASEILQWGSIKFFDKERIYKFNSIDIETVDNELFILGFTLNKKYHCTLDNFFETFNDLLVESARSNSDILTWSRYDNTHLIKMLLKLEYCFNELLLKIGKTTPIFNYTYKSFDIEIVNIINNSIIFKLTDDYGKYKTVNVYNLKNLFTTNLETTALNYNLDYYSKMSVDCHIIKKTKFNKDIEYKNKVIESNRLDNVVLIDIANNLLNDFKDIVGVVPRTLYSVGSLARTYLIAKKDELVKNNYKLQFKSMYAKNPLKDKLLDYSMRSYHGGKIESYIIGFVKAAKVTDITSAYPYALSILPRLTKKVFYNIGSSGLDKYFYAFIKCNIYIENKDFIHPLIYSNPVNNLNMSPYGHLKDITITKVEYDFLIKNNINVDVIDYMAVEHIEEYPYKALVDELFTNRMANIDNPSRANIYKIILNSLYGITYELTPLFDYQNGKWVKIGWRAGDFFNPIIASYLTAITRTSISEVDNNIVANGGKVFLNMTDSIVYQGDCTLDIFSKKKILGKYEEPTCINDIYILGAGRYQYKEKEKYTIKNRGFSIETKENGFYSNFDLNKVINIKRTEFVSFHKATTKKFNNDMLGYLIDDTYDINPLNLGGKRVLEHKNKVDYNTEYINTLPVYLDEHLY